MWASFIKKNGQLVIIFLEMLNIFLTLKNVAVQPEQLLFSSMHYFSLPLGLLQMNCWSS